MSLSHSPTALITANVQKGDKGWVAGPDVPKIQALPEWGEEGLIPAWIFLKDVSTYTEGPQR